MSPDRPIRALAQEAIDVQNASNLRGVLHGWHRALCAVDHGGVEELNLNTLYLSKVASLLHATTDAIGSVVIRRNNLRPIPDTDFLMAYEWAQREASK